MGQRLPAVGMRGSCVRDSTARCSSKEARFHNAETLCEAIITQKHFVKKRNRNIQNLGKKKQNINFLSNIFQSGVINVTLIYHKNCITYSIFSNTQQLFYIAKSSGHLN
jgi:hypothetical protein